jgi:hypothetical protein
MARDSIWKCQNPILLNTGKIFYLLWLVNKCQKIWLQDSWWTWNHNSIKSQYG